MVDAHSEHLINKFLNNFREAEEEYPDLPLLVDLQEIANSLDVKKLNPKMLMERRDCLYDLIDALNQCINMANERGRRRKALVGSKILALPGLVKYAWLFNKTRTKLREIRKKLSEMRDLRIDEHEIISEVLVIEKEALRWINLFEYYGLDEQTQKIENLMYETKGNIAIGIVGMSGSGKSVLARKVFFSLRVEQLFELMLWVDLSNAMGSEKKYECISVEEYEAEIIFCGFNLFEFLTQRYLHSSRKCLIVLDGVRHAIEGLDTFIQRILNGPVNGSVIVTSTRVEATKKLLPDKKNSYLHPIEPLGEEDCWRIFEDSIGRKFFCYIDSIGKSEALIFRSEEFPESSDILPSCKTEILSKMKNEILNRCNGLPLAVKILAEIIPLQPWKKDCVSKEEDITNLRREGIRDLRDEEFRCEEIKFRVDVHDYYTLNKFRRKFHNLFFADLPFLEESIIFSVRNYNPFVLLRQLGSPYFVEVIDVIGKPIFE